MQHSSGLYHRLKNLSTPEDIQKWILERKKRYPTKANIELKKAEELEKVQRGEVIKQKLDVTKRKRKKLVRSNNRRKPMQKQPSKILYDLEVEKKSVYRGIREFCGTLFLRENNAQEENEDEKEIVNDHEGEINQISDEEETTIALPRFTVQTSTVSSLVANYESATEDSDAPEEAPIKKSKLDDDIGMVNGGAKATAANDTVKGACFNSEAQHVSNVKVQLKPELQVRNKDKQNIALKRNREQGTKSKKQPYTSQLLQRLLSKSIQHERNVICQCIKYIVDNNFFD